MIVEGMLGFDGRLIGEGRVGNLRSSLVTVVIAALNEEEGIGPTLAELKRVLDDPDYLVVDGNSVDRTVEVAKEMGASVMVQEGMGKGRAIAQAIRRLDSDTRYVVFTDADFTYPAEYVSKMIEVLEQNPSVGMVLGNRFNHTFKLGAVTSPYFIGNRFLAVTQRLLNGVDLKDPLSGLRVVRAEIFKDWQPKSKGFDIESEMNHQVEKKGYRTVEIPIFYRRRLGEKKLKLRHGFTILRRIVLESLANVLS